MTRRIFIGAMAAAWSLDWTRPEEPERRYYTHVPGKCIFDLPEEDLTGQFVEIEKWGYPITKERYDYLRVHYEEI